MKTERCPVCRRAFIKQKSIFCPDCAEMEEDRFNRIRDYIRDRPNNNVMEVSENTGVSLQWILAFVNDERFDIGKDFNMDGLLRCKFCNEPISAGNVCATCQSKLGLGAFAAKNEKPEEDTQARQMQMYSINESSDRKKPR